MSLTSPKKSRMPKSDANRRVLIVGNPGKPGVEEAVEDVRAFAESRCTVIGCVFETDASDAVDAGVDRIIVLGGDGTLLAVSRSLGLNQIPLVGVNFGKLGFLAEFSVDALKANFDTILQDHDTISERMILGMNIFRDGISCGESLSVNDCVIHAGPPFRMIQLAIRINGMPLTTISGDGLIICTPVGSTAYNLSAGGTIMQGAVQGIAMTPLCAHSLTHRPLIVESESKFEIVIEQANEGTCLMVDGQVGYALQTGDMVSIERCSSNFLLVRNPAHPRWHGLVTKLHWGQPPSYNGI